MKSNYKKFELGLKLKKGEIKYITRKAISAINRYYMNTNTDISGCDMCNTVEVSLTKFTLKKLSPLRYTTMVLPCEVCPFFDKSKRLTCDDIKHNGDDAGASSRHQNPYDTKKNKRTRSTWQKELTRRYNLWAKRHGAEELEMYTPCKTGVDNDR